MLTFSFSYHKITLFENKYGIKLITLISMYHLFYKTSCELAGSIKIKMQMYKLLLVLTLSYPFHNYFSWTNFMDGLCILKIQ